MATNQAELSQPTTFTEPVQKSISAKIAGVLLAVYCWGVVITFSLESWKYAKQHGFISWLFLGEIVPAGKSLIWPYYLTSLIFEKGWNQEEKENLAHLTRSVNALKKVAILTEGFKKTGQLLPTDAARVRDLLSESLEESKIVRDDLLARVHKDYPKNYREKYVQCLTLLKLFLQKRDDDDVKDLLVAQKLLNEWNDWLDAHQKELNNPKNLPD
jgi:hypothetical protein